MPPDVPAVPDQHLKPSMPDLELPKPPYSTANNHAHGSSDSVSSAAEVSIARQISFSRRQRQLLVPVLSKTARQPLMPQVGNVERIQGGGRKSELVLVEDA